MTEKLKIQEILEELFQGKDAALAKYAKVRHVQYELSLLKKGLPLYDVAPSAKKYFSMRFLGGRNIYQVYNQDYASFEEALDKLDHAVNDGCHGRCNRLVKELNEELARYKIEPVDSEKFLNWLTFCYDVRKDNLGDPLLEPGFSFEIRDFYDDRNRKEFWKELKAILRDRRMMSMSDVLRIVILKRKNSKNL